MKNIYQEKGSSSYDKELSSISIGQAARQAAKYIADRRSGKIKSLKTPWQKFNDVGLGGLEWQNIITVAGPSGGGKTAILNELETALIELNPEEEFEILSFNFEMLAKNLISRKLSKKLDLSTKQLHSGEKDYKLSNKEYDDAIDECKRLSEYKIHYVDIPGNVDQIKKTILSHYARINPMGTKKGEEKGIVVMLDHSLLVKKGDSSERDLLMNIMECFNELKKMIKGLFIIASQMNRGIEDNERLQNNKMHYPRRNDIFGGDGLFMYSDIVLVTINPEMLGLDSYGPNEWPVTDRLYWHFFNNLETL